MMPLSRVQITAKVQVSEATGVPNQTLAEQLKLRKLAIAISVIPKTRRLNEGSVRQKRVKQRMGPEGLEPSQRCRLRILSPLRLPIPPWSRRRPS